MDFSHREPLAVIGIGCRFPGGINSAVSFWDALLLGLNAICDVPDDRWKHSRFHDTNPEKSGCIKNARGGFIKGVDQFDAEFFGYFPAEAQRIDPQQRLLLEVTHEAMEDAGLRRDQLDGTRTSVFIGSFMYDYLCMQTASDQRDEISPYTAMGTAICSLSNRISYDFNLKGPSVSLDTACSASLTALHLACQSVWNGEAEMAIAGGVNVMLRPEPSIMLSKGGFLNPDQYCKALDASANGYVRGEGVGIVILKPLRKAIADGDQIYACVRGTAANQDGYLPEGFTVPNVFSQVALLKAVYAEAGIDPSTVDFVEAHGTGTPVGDPVEASALGSVLGIERSSEQRNLLIGSVKTNLGHLEGAAGIAGFIKGVLTAHYGVAAPNLHFHEPNPAIPWEPYRLEVPTHPTQLRWGNRLLTVGVNSFGAGGANAHVVLQSLADARPNHEHRAPAGAGSVATLYVLSSSNRDALRTLALRHADFLTENPHRLEDIAFSAYTRRSHYSHLLAVVGESAKQVESQLRRFAGGEVDSATLATTISRRKEPKLAFVFSGQGGQWALMGLQLMHREPVFRHWMEEIDSRFRQLSEWSLLEEIRRKDGVSRVNDTVVVQPAVMAIQIAMVKLYEHYGIRPEGIVGHSIGEVAAGFAAGALTLEQAIQVIYHRSQAQNLASGKGGMLAVGLTQGDARILIAGYDGLVSIGAVNGPEMLTLSGDTEPLQQIAQVLETRGVFNRPVRVQVAYHSHHMEPIRDVMLTSLAQMQGVKATIPLYSTVTGHRENGLHFNAEYWFRNAREPVLFTDALSAMLKDRYDTFVEIGPHPVLVSGSEVLFSQLDTDAMMTPSMNRRDPEVTVFLQSLARLAARGLTPDVEVLYGSDCRYVRLPSYPWQHSRYWFESSAAAAMRKGPFEHPFLKRKTQFVTEDGLVVWEAALGVHKSPYLRDHQVDGEIVFPASGHLELAWAVASEQFRHEPFFLENIHFDLPLILPDSSRHPLEVRLEIVSAEGDYRICSRSADGLGETQWSSHSSGRINTVHDRFDKSTAVLDELRQHFCKDDALPVASFYETISQNGLEYGEKFRCIQELQHRDHEVLAKVRLPDDLLHESQRNTFHPALLDACLHAVFADVHRLGNPDRIYLPHRLARVRSYLQPTQNVWAHLLVTRNDEQYLCWDTSIFDDTGQLVAEALGMVCKRLSGAGARQTDTVYQGCYEYRWNPAPRETEIYGRNFDFTTAALIVSDAQGPNEQKAVAELATRLQADGVRPRVIPVNPDDSFDELLADIPLDRRTLIVFAVGLSQDNACWQGLANCPSVPSLLQLAQMLHRCEGVPRLCVVTNGAAGVDGDQHLDLGQAVLHGMARVINNECPNVPVTVIDLSAQISPQEVEALVGDLLYSRRDQDESEIALRGRQRFVRKLISVDREIAEQAAMTDEEGVGGNYRAEASGAGVLDQVVFRHLPLSELREDEVEIEVSAAALNFKDVVNALGLLPENAVSGGLAGHRLGVEVAGRVLRAGAKVLLLRAGDEVMARVASGFSGRVTAPAHCVVRRPERLSPQQAAAVPVIFITAWYSLCHLACLAPGETVLIHSAAGGVGGAAIQLARRGGARVIATAGTKEKRDYVRNLGIAHVFDSRSLDFYNDVMEVTGGRGVDIVLNSLPGRLITQSLKCLAPFGRFVELGKFDIYRNNKLGLLRLGENISYFVVDIDRLAIQKPALHKEVLAKVVTQFELGELQPPEITEFPISKLTEALRFMSRAAHRGKIVMNMQDEAVRTWPLRTVTFRPDRTYLISGGASGFGLEIASWMAERGAQHLVLLSRSGCKSERNKAAVEAMKKRGIDVILAQVDICDADTVRRLIQRIGNELPAIAGVIHGAAVLDDASIPNMDMERFKRVFNPKAQGAWNLHEATSAVGADLDFFLMLSSISSVLGLVGQVNYASANFFQDALAHLRRQQGLRATSINLGVLGQYAGMSSAEKNVQEIVGLLETHGILVMPLSDVLAKLEAALIQEPVQRMTARFDWARFRAAYPHLTRDARFVDLMSDAALARGDRPRSSNLLATLAELEPDQQRDLLEKEVKSKLALILDAAPERLDVSLSIDKLGLDSLMLTDLQIWIGRSVGITLPLIKLLKGPSIATLASELLAALDDSGKNVAGTETLGGGSATFTLADMEGVQVLSPWLIRGAGDPDAPVRLFCFHSMGVGASLFTRFLLNPPEDYDILAVQTPGREERMAEPVAESVKELVDQIVPNLLPLFDRPVVIWGHSFGGIVAWEVVRQLRELHGCAPVHFMVTGTEAPHEAPKWKSREIMLKAMVQENSAEYLLSQSRYVDDPEFFKMILPGMRRDMALLQTYCFQESRPLDCSMTAFAARKDDMVYTDRIREWSAYTLAGFELIEVDGDHWFLDRNRELITVTLQKIAANYLGSDVEHFAQSAAEPRKP